MSCSKVDTCPDRVHDNNLGLDGGRTQVISYGVASPLLCRRVEMLGRPYRLEKRFQDAWLKMHEDAYMYNIFHTYQPTTSANRRVGCWYIVGM